MMPKRLSTKIFTQILFETFHCGKISRFKLLEVWLRRFLFSSDLWERDPLHLPEKHFLEITFPRKTHNRNYIIPNIHFPERAFSRNDISLNVHLPEITLA